MMKDGQDERAPLGSLDPEVWDPGFWERFHRRVLARAAGELARRRSSAPRVNDLLLSWSRAVVPAALLAASLGGVLALRGLGPTQEAATLQELLAPEDADLAAALAASATLDAVNVFLADVEY
ncbi:MAG: hypothetical protein HY701_10460 [Gemmatimonadetes bacterium]|nr:hypothetical protein [Gemmatimonadota bacterium]